MLLQITLYAVIFGIGWFEALQFRAGQTLTIWGRTFNFEDMSQAVRLIVIGLIIAVVARYGEGVLKSFNRRANRAEAWAKKQVGK